MKAHVIVQENLETGDKHVTFTTDTLTPREDMLCNSPGWEDAKVTEGTVLILGMDEANDDILDALIETELHTAMTPHPSPAVDNIRVHQGIKKLMEDSNASV
jgi:hypothetical protein